jgi:hypothetical protein
MGCGRIGVGCMLTPKAVEATFGTTPNESWGSHGEQRGGNRSVGRLEWEERGGL